MDFGVAGHLDVEPVAGLLADEGDELRGIAEFARDREAPRAGRPRSATMWRMPFALYSEITSRSCSRVEAMQDRCGRGVLPFGADLQHGAEGPSRSIRRPRRCRRKKRA
jgi:hypothetical protein